MSTVRITIEVAANVPDPARYVRDAEKIAESFGTLATEHIASYNLNGPEKAEAFTDAIGTQVAMTSVVEHTHRVLFDSAPF